MSQTDIWRLQAFLPQMFLEVSTGYYIYLETSPSYYYISIIFCLWLTTTNATKGSTVALSAKG